MAVKQAADPAAALNSASTPLLRLWELAGSLYWSSPRTTFQVLPITVIVLETLRRRSLAVPDLRFTPLLAWGYLQYRLVGKYRSRTGGGAGGMAGLPSRLATSGPYLWTRNPMYLGHLIFSVGLVLSFRSPVAFVFAVSRVVYFQLRVSRDEERLARLFGDDYREYRLRVKRWIPGLV